MHRFSIVCKFISLLMHPIIRLTESFVIVLRISLLEIMLTIVL